MRRLLACSLVFFACKSGIERGTLQLTTTCQALSARACTCEGGATGVAFCDLDSGVYGTCDCRYVLDSSLCTADFQEGEDAKCVVERPTCEIVTPLQDAVLNGVSVAQGGQRVSAQGSPYAASFVVETNAEDGSEVRLTVDGASQSFLARVQVGRAVFDSVVLGDDGVRTLVANCRSVRGVATDSAPRTVIVDQTAPALSISEPTQNAHLQPSTDVDAAKSGMQFRVCGAVSETTATFCVSIGLSVPTCAAQGAACVNLDCPGGAPFDLIATLRDLAGNASTATQTGVSCAIQVPSVQIVSPTQGSRLLAPSAPTGLKDKLPLYGAQTDVVVCSDTLGSVTLETGVPPLALSQLGSAIPLQPAQPADGCPAGYSTSAHFDSVTLPQSVESATGELERLTRIAAHVTDLSGEPGTSPSVDLWVDTVPPVNAAYVPNPICGVEHTAAGDFTYTDFYMIAERVPFTLTVTDELGMAVPYTFTTLNYYAFSPAPIVLHPGVNTLALDMVEPSGNETHFPANCTATVNNNPRVTWVAPAAGVKSLNRATSSGSPGWSGDLIVSLDLGGAVGATGGSGATVEFTSSLAGTLGSAACVALDANTCTATLPVSALAEADDVVITARVTDGVRGTSQSSRHFLVDTLLPSAPTGLVASVKDRRQTSFHLAWTAPSDQGAQVHDYQILVGATGGTGRAVVYPSAPGLPGSTEGIDAFDLLIETSYVFTVSARDAAGNVSAPAMTPTVRASFIVEILNSPPPAQQYFGSFLEGTHDFNRDGFTDLMVAGFASRLYVFFGSATGYGATPNIEFQGPAGSAFGYGAQVLGDVDGDGLADLAVSASNANGDGGVYIFAGRLTWPSLVDVSQALSFVAPNRNVDPLFTGSGFGLSLTALGDFDRDGANDFAVGAYGYDYAAGMFAVVRGVKAPEVFPSYIEVPTDLDRLYLCYGDHQRQTSFGDGILGVGPFFGDGAHPIVVTDSNSGANNYVFRGPQASHILDLNDADEVVVSPPHYYYNVFNGTALTHAGFMGGAPMVALASGSGTDYLNQASLYYGSLSAGVLGGTRVAIRSSLESTVIHNDFGQIIVGGGIDGTTTSLSFIGGPEPDLWVAAVREGDDSSVSKAGTLYLIDGSKLLSASRPSSEPLPVVLVPAAADVTLSAPSGWKGNALGSMISDADGDGYPDLAVSEVAYDNGFGGPILDGRVYIVR